MSDSTPDEAERIPIAAQAAHYWVALHAEQVSTEVRKAFAAWAARSPHHVAAYLRMARAVRAVRQSEVQWPQTSAEDLIRDALAKRADVVQFRPGLQVRGRDASAIVANRPHRTRVFSALAAAVALVICAALMSWELWRSNHYETGVGEQRSVALEDGSIVTLNTSSEIEVNFTGRQRKVRLVEGEALFQVAHDARRPFDVLDGMTTVRAVGTEFNVDRRQTQTTVTVVEGRVAVIRPTSASDQTTDSGPVRAPAGSILLAATEQLVIANGQIGVPARVANVSPVLAWTHRQLVFNRRPIGEVAAEFNRYNRLRIEIASPSLADEPLTGVFQANDPQSFLTFLAHMPGVSIDTGRSTVIVNQR